MYKSTDKHSKRKHKKRKEIPKLNKLNLRQKTVNFVDINMNQENPSAQHGENAVNSAVEETTSNQSGRRYIQLVRNNNLMRING